MDKEKDKGCIKVMERYLTEYDLYLFNEGSNFRAYEKLGSHVIELDGVRGVHFAVWAPNAESVSVIGSFNDWDPSVHPMSPNGSSGVWSIFVPEAKEGDLYKYHIKSRIEGMVRIKSDPYGFFFELRPKTATVVYDINRYTWNDREWMETRRHTDQLNRPFSIYEVHLGSWMRREDGSYLSYRELAEKLIPYVLEMGFTHIELLPVTEHPLDESWGYQCTGYFAPTSRYGTPEEFMYFIDKCHQAGIGVILDWVPAHFPKDDFSLRFFDGTCLYEHEDPRKGEHRDWGTLIFNYGRNEVRSFLISSACFWLDKYHIDGLRVDAVASMLYLDYSRQDGEWIPNIYGGRENLEAIDFIKRFNEVVHLYWPGAVTVAEESTAWPGVSRPTYLGGLGFTMKWNMGWMHDILEYFTKDPIFRKYHHGNLTFSLLYAFTENFVLPLSHDEVVHGKRSLLDKMPGDLWQKFANLRALLGYMFGHPGKKLLFMGGEFGQWWEWDCNSSLQWHLLNEEGHRKLQQYVKDLNRIYKSEPALYEVDFHHEGFEWIDFSDTEQSIISFMRKARNDDNFLVFVCNFTPVPREGYLIGVPQKCFYREILNSDSAIYGGTNMGNLGGVMASENPVHERPYSISITLPPLSVLIFKPE
ncbi:MAG TPA: 1,4-alpha-glucan branching protein GlgB [Nitrospirae bacterium]|nr:1,4-alpha-glucan branching protein GlgB [Nitrospirota bacterium]